MPSSGVKAGTSTASAPPISTSSTLRRLQLSCVPARTRTAAPARPPTHSQTEMGLATAALTATTMGWLAASMASRALSYHALLKYPRHAVLGRRLTEVGAHRLPGGTGVRRGLVGAIFE